MIGSTYSPKRWIDVESSKVQPNTFGIQSTITKNTIQNIDTLISDDVLVRGIEFLAENVNFGDIITIEIIDINGVYFPVNTVISTPITNFNITPNLTSSLHYDAITPNKLLGGLYIRTIYTSTSLTTDVNIGINFLLVKILI